MDTLTLMTSDDNTAIKNRLRSIEKAIEQLCNDIELIKTILYNLIPNEVNQLTEPLTISIDSNKHCIINDEES